MAQGSQRKVEERSLSALIRREMRSETNARFLRNLDLFRTESGQLPSLFDELLGRLDQSERGSR